MTEDRILIYKILSQNETHAYAELVHRYQSRLRNSLRQLTGWNESLADDLAQETFIKAFNQLHSFKGEAKFYSWLYTIAYRVFIDDCRAKKLNPLDNLTQSEDTPSVESAIMRTSNIHRDFARALQTLPSAQAISLHLHLQDEYTHSEIASIMDLPLGTVKSYIQRGKNKLKVLLSDWHDKNSAPGE